MLLAGHNASSEERALDAAFEDLVGAFAASPISVPTQRKVIACTGDVLAIVPMALELQEQMLQDFEEDSPWSNRPSTDALRRHLVGVPFSRQRQMAKAWNRDHAAELQAEWDAIHEYMERVSPIQALHSSRFAVTMKALFFFIRALQDAGAAVLREVATARPGKYTSMNKLLGKPNPIVAALPGYREWFQQFRDIRDRMKLGVDVGPEMSSPGPRLVLLRVQEHDSTSTARVLWELTWTDVERALHESARLLSHLAKLVRTLPTPQA